MTKVAIGVITYRRPEGLRRLLESLDTQTFADSPPDARIVVIDNDPEGGARELCERLKRTSKWPLEYYCETNRGIPQARNRAIICTVDQVDYLAFIDDDEIASHVWLDTLLRVQQQYDADVVAGPVEPRFEPGTPTWLVTGGFFRRPRFPTGHALGVAFTGNVLIRGSLLRQLDRHFDERLALCGGSDSHFFRRLAKAGHRLVWADEAEVDEWVPRSKATVGWLMRRSFRTANSMAFTNVDLARWPWAMYPVVVAKGLVWLAIGLLVATAGLVLGRRYLVRGARFLSYGSGLLSGLFGLRYQEYQSTYGG